MTSIPKITVVGDANVGKTSIIDRLVFNTFNPLSHSTIGVNHLTKKIDDMNVWELFMALFIVNIIANFSIHWAMRKKLI